MSEAMITVDVQDGIADLQFCRPRQRNALNNELMRQTIDEINRLNSDETVGAIIVSGQGQAFSSGFDLKAAAERQLDGHEAWRAQLELQFEFIMSFWNSTVPTISAVHGFCLAGGFEVCLACDMTICTEDAIFGEPEVRFGSGAVAMLFPWVLGPKQAKEIVLSGEDRISAQRGLEMGFVNRITPPGEHHAEAKRLARRIVRASPAAVKKSKQAINRAYDVMGLRQALAIGLDIDVDINAAPSWENEEFSRIRKEQGVKAAIAWRDARFKDET